MKHFLIDILDAARWRCTAWRALAVPWLIGARRWLGPPRPGVPVGVLLDETAWVVVQPDLAAFEHARTVLELDSPTLTWQENTVSLSPVPMPELRFSHREALLAEDELALWQLALQSIHAKPSSLARRLVLAWPDEALWSATFTLTGPATDDEWQAWLLEELEAVLPCPLDEVAWDCRWSDAMGGMASVDGPGRAPWWRRWMSGGRSVRQSASWDGHRSVTCWALPRHLAKALVRIAARQGFESLSVEPRSVALNRAARLASQAPSLMASPEGVTAWGAACRSGDERPNLLRRQRFAVGWRLRALAPGYLPWLVALVVTGSLGWTWGAAQAEDWHRSAQTLEQRLRQLQSQSDQRQQARQRQQQARQQALDQHAQQQARETHNLQFAHALQGMAATLPDGVRWQQLDLRPRQLELHAQALDAPDMSQWLARWAQSLPTGGQPRLQWQVLSPALSSPSASTQASIAEGAIRAVSGRAASGVAASNLEQARSPLAIHVQWAWSLTAGGVE